MLPGEIKQGHSLSLLFSIWLLVLHLPGNSGAGWTPDAPSLPGEGGKGAQVLWSGILSSSLVHPTWGRSGCAHVTPEPINTLSFCFGPKIVT